MSSDLIVKIEPAICYLLCGIALVVQYGHLKRETVNVRCSYMKYKCFSRTIICIRCLVKLKEIFYHEKGIPFYDKGIHYHESGFLLFTLNTF